MARSILVIRPDEIGDVILTTPFLRALRACASDAHITALVSQSCAELLELCPEVDEVVAMPFSAGTTASARLRLCASALRMRWSRVPSRRFELVLLPRADDDHYDAHLVAHLVAGWAPVIAHRDTAVARSPASQPPFPSADLAIPSDRVAHEAARPLEFLQACGANVAAELRCEIHLGHADRRFVDEWLRGHGFAARPFIVVHPSGGRAALKQWPEEHFRSVVRGLVAATGYAIVVVGGKDEEWITASFGAVRSPDVALGVGAFSLRQLGALLERAELFIGGDSGPMHLASACGAALITVFGSTSEVRFRPLGQRSKVVSLRYEYSPDAVGTFEDRCHVCRYGAPRCLTELSAELVLDEALRTLDAGRRARSARLEASP